jgi:hypothetical protein
MPSVLKLKDKTDSFTTNKAPLFNLPFRLLMVGKSGMGKTNYLANMLLRSSWYRGDFDASNIYIFSGSLHGDAKLHTIINELDIPESNLFDNYDELALEAIYDHLVEEYNDAVADRRRPQNSLIVFDDLGFSNHLNAVAKKNDQIHRLFANGRKSLISTAVLVQKLTQLSTTARENATGVIVGQMTNKQLDLLDSDFNYLGTKKEFRDMVRAHTDGPHDTMTINFSVPYLYQTSDFKEIPTSLHRHR